MSSEDLQTFIHHRPFQAIRLFVSDGAVYDIRHPDLIMVGKRSVVIGMVQDPQQTVYDRFASVDLLHITRVEPIESQAAAG